MQKITAAKSKTAKQKLEKKFGGRYTSLLELDYFDPVTQHVIDPMHNLFLGTAKRMFKIMGIPGFIAVLCTFRH